MIFLITDERESAIGKSACKCAFMSKCRTDDFRDKEVVNVCDGRKLGCISEIEFDVCDGRITAIVIYGKKGMFGKGEDDVVIPWDKIEKIGDDIILVNAEDCYRPSLCACDHKDDKRKGFL